MSTPLRIAVIGMGGFAARHHDAIMALEAEGMCRLCCTCDPAIDTFDERRQQLQFDRRGVRLFHDYLDMLDRCRAELDVVTIPTPIPLHAPMHQACVERGLAVYLEKPPTLDIDELERMLAVEKNARHETMVGFNFIVEPERQALKRRLVDGEFGTVRCVTVYGHWPRNTAYYQRAGWAGRLMLEERPVLDSPMGNALAHYVHNGLFWAGTNELFDWGRIEQVEAELYRAHDIEGTDTVFVRAGISGGPEMRLTLSHACAAGNRHYERISCEGAEIEYIVNRREEEGPPITIRPHNAPEEEITTPTPASTTLNLRTYCEYVRGTKPRPPTRLEDSRPFVELNDLAYLAAGNIATIPASFRETHDDGFLSVSGLKQAMDEFAAHGIMPSVQGLPWAVAGGHATRADLPRLHQAVRQMVDNRQPA